MRSCLTALRQHLTYSNVMVTLLLFIVLGGTAWAALGPDTVGSPQIKDNAVKSSELSPNAISSAKIPDGSIASADLATGVVPAPQAKRINAQVAGGSPVVVLLDSKGLTLKLECIPPIQSPLAVEAYVYASGPTGATLNWTETEKFTTGNPPEVSVDQKGKVLESGDQTVHYTNSASQETFGVAQASGIFNSQSGTVTYDINIVASQSGNNGVCSVSGTAVTTP